MQAKPGEQLGVALKERLIIATGGLEDDWRAIGGGGGDGDGDGGGRERERECERQREWRRHFYDHPAKKTKRLARARKLLAPVCSRARFLD